MKCYKGFNKDLMCRGFRYEIGKTYETDKAEMCETGFHACKNPLDVFSYYAVGDSRYAEVNLEVNKETASDSKRVGKKISIKAELSIKDLVKSAVSYISDTAATSGDGANAATSGNSANAATSGNSAHAATSGDFAHAATSGDFAHAATSGNRAHAATSGDFANAATSGDGANAATSGDGANAATSGNSAHAGCNGKRSIACAIGKDSFAKNSIGNFIVLAEYKEDKDGMYYPLCVKVAKVDGVKIKADTWYKLEKRKFVENKGETK
jgi:hypothetical protein